MAPGEWRKTRGEAKEEINTTERENKHLHPLAEGKLPMRVLGRNVKG